MEGLEVIKQLVDSLTISLTNILMKIESINPILTRLSEDIKEGKNVSQETIDSINELKHEILSYHESMVQLPVTLANINSIYDITKKLDEKIDDIKNKTDTIPNISQQFEDNNKILTPISKIANFFTEPIGKIVGFITVILAIAGAAETIQWLIETFSK